MALVVFLRGVNVGGHRTFRPSVVAEELRAFDVINIGAAGTFVVRKPGERASFVATLAKKLPFETQIVTCEGRDVLGLQRAHPFGDAPITREIVRFVSVLAKSSRARPTLPMTLPAEGDWFLRVLATKGRFVLGEYRRDMKAIGHLGRLDALFGAPATTRSWSTLEAIARVLRS